MSRYIDADALIAEMSEKHRPNFHEDLKAYHMWIMWYWALKDAPSIDIVRCKECEHHFYDEPNDCKMCRIHEYGEIWEDDDFCSYGERKESE